MTGTTPPICKPGPEKNAKFSCNKICKEKNTPEEIVILDETEEFQVNFAEDVKKGCVNSVSWVDIDEASENDKKIKILRTALMNNDDETIRKEISGLKISDNWANPAEIVKTSSGIKIEDLSLYKNCIGGNIVTSY